MRIPVLCPDIPVPDVRHGIEPDAAGLAGAARHQPEAAAFVLEDDNMRAAGREAHQETGGARIETWLQGGRGAIVHRLDPELVSAEAIGPHPVGIIRKLVVGRHQIVGQPVPVRRKLRCADTFRSEDILQPEIVALDRRGICAQSPCPSDQAHGDRGDENTPGPEPAAALLPNSGARRPVISRQDRDAHLEGLAQFERDKPPERRGIGGVEPGNGKACQGRRPGRHLVEQVRDRQAERAAAEPARR